MSSFEGARIEGFKDSREGARMQKGIQGMLRGFWAFFLTDPAVTVEGEALRDPSTGTVLGEVNSTC
jgi:hypothetical protein